MELRPKFAKPWPATYSPTLILVGRSPLPADEPAELRELADIPVITQISDRFDARVPGVVTPAQIEQALRRF